jgi:hypothetical protein
MRSVFGAVAVLSCAVPAAAQGREPARRPAAQAPDTQRVSFGVAVSSDTVTIGQPFELRVRVRAPAGATIRFPDAPDTAGAVHARDPRVVQTDDSVAWLDQTAVYRVAAWDVGDQDVLLADAIVSWRAPSARDQRVPLGRIRVHVRSVLPADSSLRVPKPARPLWEVRGFPWWLVALAAALALALWWWWRRRRRTAAVAAVTVDPYDHAVAAFGRVDALGLMEAGERTRFVALMVEVLRDYLAARYPDAPLSLTSRELTAALRRRSAVPADALARTLHDADLAKFAGLSLTDDRARAIARDARAIVEREHAATTAPGPQVEAAA